MPAQVYLAYAPKDQALLQQLCRHLSGLERAGLIRLWSDQQIGAGEDWEKSKSKALLAADLIVLLVSADFLAHPTVYEKEVKVAMEQEQAGKAQVIPLILRECIWQYESYAHLQALPSNGEPVTSDAWENEDDAFADIVEQIAALAQKETATKKGGGFDPGWRIHRSP